MHFNGAKLLRLFKHSLNELKLPLPVEYCMGFFKAKDKVLFSHCKSGLNRQLVPQPHQFQKECHNVKYISTIILILADVIPYLIGFFPTSA